MDVAVRCQDLFPRIWSSLTFSLGVARDTIRESALRPTAMSQSSSEPLTDRCRGDPAFDRRQSQRHALVPKFLLTCPEPEDRL
jgi:hypothetical protein